MAETTYALEGSAFNAGSAIKWLRDELKLIANPQEADLLAETVEDAGGVGVCAGVYRAWRTVLGYVCAGRTARRDARYV